MGFLILINQLVSFLLLSVITVSVGLKVLSYLNTRVKFYGYIALMLFISALMSMLLGLLTQQARADVPKTVAKTPYLAIISNAAKEEDVPDAVLTAICTVESGLNASLVHEDDGNGPSVGLCQIKPETARLMGFTGKLKDLLDPKINATYAAKYFKWQMDRYFNNVEYAIAAYNAGSLHLNSKKQIRNRKYVTLVMVMVAVNENR